MLSLLCAGKLVHATDHVAELTNELLALLQDVDGEEEGVEVGGSVLHAVQGTLAVVGDLLLNGIAVVAEFLGVGEVTRLEHGQCSVIELHHGLTPQRSRMAVTECLQTCFISVTEGDVTTSSHGCNRFVTSS